LVQFGAQGSDRPQQFLPRLWWNTLQEAPVEPNVGRHSRNASTIAVVSSDGSDRDRSLRRLTQLPLGCDPRSFPEGVAKEVRLRMERSAPRRISQAASVTAPPTRLVRTKAASLCPASTQPIEPDCIIVEELALRC